MRVTMHPAERCAVERICNFAPRIKFPAVSSSNGFSYSLDQQRCAPRRIRRGPGRRLAAGRLALNEAQSIVQSVAHNAQSLIEPNLLRAAQLVCPRRTGTVHLSVHVTQESNTRPPTTTITTSHAPPHNTRTFPLAAGVARIGALYRRVLSHFLAAKCFDVRRKRCSL